MNLSFCFFRHFVRIGVHMRVRPCEQNGFNERLCPFTSVRVLNEVPFYGIKILITILASVTGFATTSGQKPKFHADLVP